MANVMLLEYTNVPHKIIAAAAKLCYSDESVANLKDNLTNESACKFVDILNEIGHESPIEHASFTFGIDGISRACMAQITRHRVASFNVQSQRYVKKSKFEFVVPPEIENMPKAKKIFLKAMDFAQNAYEELASILQEKHEKILNKNGLSDDKAKNQAEKLSIEDARFVLPNSCATKMIATMNARTLKHFFEVRCCNRAQWEIRDVAYQMLKLVKNVAPTIFRNAGPSCVRGICKEGKMSCLKAEEVREKCKSI